MCSIEYTESMVGNGLVAFDLNALPATGNTITSQVSYFESIFKPIHKFHRIYFNSN